MPGKTGDRRRRGWQSMSWLDGITNTIDFATWWTVACQTSLSMEFSSKNTGVSCHYLTTPTVALITFLVPRVGRPGETTSHWTEQSGFDWIVCPPLVEVVHLASWRNETATGSLGNNLCFYWLHLGRLAKGREDRWKILNYQCSGCDKEYWTY